MKPVGAVWKSEALSHVCHIGLLLDQLRSVWRVSSGLNATDHAAFAHLVADGPMTSVELARRLGMTTASVVFVLDRLTEREFVVRRPHPTDRRKHLIYATKQAHQLSRELWEPLDEHVAELEQSADTRISASTSKLLDRITELIESELATKAKRKPPS